MMKRSNYIWILLIHIYWLHKASSQTTERYCGNIPADVVFMLDSSNSMWGPHFVEQLQFVKNVTNMFDIGPNATQVGLATFNDNVQLQFYLNEYHEKERLLRAIGLVEQSYGPSTATDKAVNYLRTYFFNARYGARPDVAHVAVIMTDGKSDNMLRTLIEATKAKRQNIAIFTIGIGNAVNSLELERMASSPTHEYAFIVDNFSFLNSIKEKLAIRTCMVTTPPTTAAPTRSPPTWTTPTTEPTPATTAPAQTLAPMLNTQPPTTAVSTPEDTTIWTTPVPTTTAIPLPTTTTWVDLVRRICEKKPVDVVFALDSSDLVDLKEFWYQQKFVRDFATALDVGANKTRISVVLFSNNVVPGFNLNQHNSLAGAIADLNSIQRIYGGTRLDEVIHYVTTKSFLRSISRKNSAQLLVLITGSASPIKLHHLVKQKAMRARKTGIEILTIGVGDKVNQEELSIISGVQIRQKGSAEEFFSTFSKEDTTPRRQHLYQVSSFSQLSDIVMSATIEACTAEIAPVAVSDQACGTRQEADLMFVMDTESTGKKNTQKSLKLVKKLFGAMEIGTRHIQTAVKIPDECVHLWDSYGLNSHKDKDHVMSALEEDDKGDNLLGLMTNITKDFKRGKGGRKGSKKIAIVLVDGTVERPLDILKEARKAQTKGIEIFVIFVGSSAPQPEIQSMCDYPPQKHFLQAQNYDRLLELEQTLIDLLCDPL